MEHVRTGDLVYPATSVPHTLMCHRSISGRIVCMQYISSTSKGGKISTHKVLSCRVGLICTHMRYTEGQNEE